MKSIIPFLRNASIVITLLLPGLASATGMSPETSLLLIKEAEQGGVMNVKNTDAFPSLLHTQIVPLSDEDKGIRLITTQPVVRVEPGHTQQVRFILQTDKPLTTEHLMRVTFEGIPPKTTGINKVGLTIRQDLPVLIRPKNLPDVQDAWTLLEWQRNGGGLEVHNPSPYVVRLGQQVITLPSQTPASLAKSYILPGQTLRVTSKKPISMDTQVRFAPVSRYGVAVPEYLAPLK